MNPDQLAEYRLALSKGKPPDDKLSPDRVFLRGWSEGVQFAENLLNRILKDAGK